MPCTKGPGTNGGEGHLEDSERAHDGTPGSQVDHGPTKVYIDKHPDFGEYKVHLGGKKSTGIYESDKDAAIGTAKAAYGSNANVVHRSRRYGPDGE